MKHAEINLVSELRTRGMSEIADAIMTILDERENRIHDLEKKVKESENRYETVSKALDHFVQLELQHYTEIMKAFTDNDPHGHRDYHEKLIKSAEAQAALYNTMRVELVKRGFFWGTILLLGFLWVGFEVKVKAWLGL